MLLAMFDARRPLHAAPTVRSLLTRCYRRQHGGRMDAPLLHSIENITHPAQYQALRNFYVRGSGGRLQDLPGRRVRPPVGLEGDVGPASAVGADGQQELGDQVRRARLHSAHALLQPVRDHGLAAGQREHRGSAARQFVSS